ncbi:MULTISPECIES: GH92 family glycosyl hydrolase [unclassified Caulobacter]|uniref:GH92 family glycosyl hydrolase n=1 Tax=unclassified Caulobacter TaxID=2648921 RepID=UPI0006F1F378|nr:MULTISPECIES: GH92 family glycosyl hydrolase [unclassified Caulobacter]KQV62765.1 sugar hydrolase [Caulobacter sp. Root342]KQV71898.1 sugar hydrolase [Caulobacter sp. Root343]
MRLCSVSGLALLASLPLLAASPVLAQISSAYDAVDPFIGTGGDGHTFPGAVVPFGMVQLSPDTEILPFKQSYARAAGYRFGDPTILGFSHTHFSGAGHSDLGDILLTPVAGEAKLEPGEADKPGSGYRSRYSHDTEVAQPGYYAVTLSDSQVRAELTAGLRTGLHRYTFQKGQRAQVLIDLRSSIYNYPGKVLWSRLRVAQDGTVTGYRETRGWAPGRKLFFAIRFDKPLVGQAFHNREADIPYKGFAQPGRTPEDRAQVQGRALVGVFDFGQIDGPLTVKVALSSVSEDGAIANLASDEPGFDFDAQRARARSAWEKALGAVDIEAPAPMRKTLYTALYHTLLAPSVFADADGRYRGTDDQVHEGKLDGRPFTFHSTFSLWDTFRAEHPLLTLVQPADYTNDVVNSLIASQRQSPYGILPVWQFHGQETWTMIGYHAVPVIADAWMKGIRGYDGKAALDAMVKSATYAPYGGLGDYMKLGYVPIDKEPEAASKTVEYAYDDWTIARMARDMGQDEVAKAFEKRASYWRNSFDVKTGFLRARKSDGTYREPFNPTAINYGSDYTEGNAWQYSWFAPQDLGGIVKALGGDAATVKKLDAMFDFDNSKIDYSHAEDIAGLIGQYIHGNEPSHHVAYMYDYAGAPWRTQARLSQIIKTQYKPTPDGLSGNDDLGQMSAWLMFTSLGFYPVTPASNEYAIGRPFVDKAALNLPNGKRFTVRTEGLADARPYVGKVTLNGKPLTRAFLKHDEIVAGGELVFTMSATPNKAWATRVQDRPTSSTGYR